MSVVSTCDPHDTIRISTRIPVETLRVDYNAFAMRVPGIILHFAYESASGAAISLLAS